jgi:hypothetical protein
MVELDWKLLVAGENTRLCAERGINVIKESIVADSWLANSTFMCFPAPTNAEEFLSSLPHYLQLWMPQEVPADKCVPNPSKASILIRFLAF